MDRPKCSICLEEIQGMAMSTGKCVHPFCVVCLESWRAADTTVQGVRVGRRNFEEQIMTTQTCPDCRIPFEDADISFVPVLDPEEDLQELIGHVFSPPPATPGPAPEIEVITIDDDDE